MKHAVALVPGFLGFAQSGTLSYFADRFIAGVRGAVEARVHADIPIIPLDTRPVGSLAARQELLCEQLRRLDHELGGKRVWHLVGHSAGGLDSALLLRTDAVVDARDGSRFGGRLDTKLDIASAIAIAAPHHGTGLACTLTGVMAKVLRGVLLARDACRDGGELPERVRFVTAGHTSLITLLFNNALARDLKPSIAGALTATSNRNGRPLFSIATCAPAPTRRGDPLFRDLYNWTSNLGDRPAPADTTAPWISAIGPLPRDVRANDAVVNTLRQLDGTVLAFVAGDHGDVIGQYRRRSLVDRRLLDEGLLTSNAQFGDDQFFELTRTIAACLAGTIGLPTVVQVPASPASAASPDRAID